MLYADVVQAHLALNQKGYRADGQAGRRLDGQDGRIYSTSNSCLLLHPESRTGMISARNGLDNVVRDSRHCIDKCQYYLRMSSLNSRYAYIGWTAEIVHEMMVEKVAYDGKIAPGLIGAGIWPAGAHGSHAFPRTM